MGDLNKGKVERRHHDVLSLIRQHCPEF